MIYFCFPQRKDYTALTKFLPPKHEYVLLIRVTPLQCKLYRYYVEHFTGDYHTLVKIIVTPTQGVANGTAACFLGSCDIFGFE